ncbi:MAG TPA: potassium-transporting ATPase subunit KdpA [Candidatus Binataceae bacterium]|nr:potassium-transporting ATPase subunit KdpA [Candidatus Binataceae bacterium]HYB89406.1 potassium-transporting ATPase subunit KdpA [Candidatus Binataceae bacterium]
MWLLPFIVIAVPALLAIPLSRYLAWIMDGQYQPPRLLEWFERRVDNGPMGWKQYAIALLVFNTVLYVFGYFVLVSQPWMPLNPRGLGALAPTTIFNTVISFATNTDIQHYSGDVAFSNFSQIFFCIPMFFLSAAIGFCALTAIIRSFRSDDHVGNFFLDMWRVVFYTFLPAAFALSLVFLTTGMPMTFQSAYQVNTLEPAAMGTDNNNQPKQQTIVVGPLAAFVPMKMLGTNGGGFYGMNSAHPFENPTAFANFLTTSSMMLFPMALVLMFGRMLKRNRHAAVIFSVMLAMLVGTVLWVIYFDTLKPNPGLIARPQTRTFEIPSASASGGKRVITLPAVAGLPVDQHLGNLEGKELRFGTSAAATFAAATVDFTCGAIICEHDSLNPVAALSPFFGMWVNCIFGGKGVGMINMLLFLIIGIFVVGQMVGRTPEYLGKKIGAREVTLALIALLIHPLVILGPSGLFAAKDWGVKAESNPGAHGFSQIVYQFSSDSANNGSAFDGMGVSYGLNNNPSPAPEAVPWDIGAGFVIMLGRFIPIFAPIAMAGFLGMKKSTPFGLGTLRDDTVTFGCMLFGTIVIIGALLFLPVAALGPLAEHWGPIPFGG